jgi:regulator of replication initiation timing
MYGRDNRFEDELRDFMPKASQPPELISFKDPLELKDQHLVALANTNGYLAGRISVLEPENARLNAEVRELRDKLKKYEISESQAQAGYKSGQQLVDEIGEALTKKLKELE